MEICGCVQQVRKPTRGNNTLDLMFTINIDSISVHTSHEVFMSDHRIVLSIIHSLNVIQFNSKVSMMYQSRHFDQQTWKRAETLIHWLPWETYFTTNNVDIVLSNLYHNLIYCLDCTAPVIGRVAYDANRGQNTFKRKLRKLKYRYYEQKDVYALQSIHKLIDRNASSKQERSQIFRFGSCYSKPVNVTSGVIQGSVVGSLHFLLFIND
ncbi:unnamed protein product, partial [Schistosoma bovis]